MNKKIVIAAICLIFFLILVLLFNLKTVTCFSLNENESSKICYEKSAIFNSYSNHKNKFEQLVNAVNGSGGISENLLYIEESLAKGMQGDVRERIKKLFSWLNEDSLIYVIEGTDKSAFLMKKDNKNYVIYFDEEKNVFYFSYDTQIEYLPVDRYWVNMNRSEGINSYYTLRSVLDSDGECDFAKNKVIVTASEKQGEGVCIYGEYKYNLVSKNILIVNGVNDGVVDDIMQFLYWATE